MRRDSYGVDIGGAGWHMWHKHRCSDRTGTDVVERLVIGRRKDFVRRRVKAKVQL